MNPRLRRIFTAVIGGAGGGAVYSIAGVVYDANGSTAIQSATVALGAYSAVSAADGTYTISGIPAGTSGSMTCTKTGYSWTAISIAAMSGDLTAQNYTNAWWAAGGCAASCVGAYAAKNAASQAASYVNLANPGTYNLTATSAPTWDATNGWTFAAASSQFLKTGIFMTSVNWSMVVAATGVTNALTALFGVRNIAGGDIRWALLPNYGGATYYMYGTAANAMSIASAFANGTLGIAGNKGFRNGSPEAGTIASPAYSGTYELYIGAWNGSNAAANFISASVQKIAFYSSVLTDAQMGAVMNANP